MPFAPTGGLSHVLSTHGTVARIPTTRMNPARPARSTKYVAAAQHLDLFAIGSTTRDPVVVHRTLHESLSKRRSRVGAFEQTVSCICFCCFFIIVNHSFLLVLRRRQLIQFTILADIISVIKGFQANRTAPCSKLALQMLRLLSIHTRQFASLICVLPPLSAISVFAPLPNTHTKKEKQR